MDENQSPIHTPGNEKVRQNNPLQKRKVKVAKMVAKARAKLEPWAKSEADAGKLGLGGLEGIPVLIMIASFDPDADGELNDEEWETYIEKGNAVIDKVLALSNTVALVAALLLSILLPLIMSWPEASDKSKEFFGSSGIEVLGVFYAVALTIVVTATLAGLMLAVFVIVILSSWLIEIDDKLDWIIGNTVIITQQALCMWTMEISLAFTVVFGAFHAKVLLGFFAICPAVAAIYVFTAVGTGNIDTIDKLNFQTTKELMGIEDDIEVGEV